MAVTSDNKLLLCNSSDDMSWIFLSVFWMIVICFRKVKNSWLLEPWSFKNSSSCLLSFKIDVNWLMSCFSLFKHYRK
jgi:hypothetical protein